jgi:hypothetical protein
MLCIYLYFLQCVLYAMSISSSSCDNFNNIWQGVQIMKLIIMQFSPASCYVFPLHDAISNAKYMDKFTMISEQLTETDAKGSDRSLI